MWFLGEVPDTGFSCGQQQFPGIYTDLQTQCQVFYMCEPNGRSTGFLCPNGTIFNQQYFVCDWWYNLDCAQQQEFYSLNQFLYQENDDYNEYDYEDLKWISAVVLDFNFHCTFLIFIKIYLDINK